MSFYVLNQNLFHWLKIIFPAVRSSFHCNDHGDYNDNDDHDDHVDHKDEW